ncbi:hypothetical protein [Mucilaginibacter lappiensis]|uniref:Uncharacterized protein n=1 Tax=Mucilaginibacter lappiensis TaxID=354630 RepID=A0A841J5T7_9SPHI|nr:hypothetical protein [Mucilaginibacter lappiensis]MBB6126383.1 hypothetical protein [Mucilaginibacter lappiensis]
MYNNPLIQPLIARRAVLLQELTYIDGMLKLHGVDNEDGEIPDYTGIEALAYECPYKKGANSQEKLVSLLKLTNRFLSINELTGLVHDFEPKLKPEDIKASLGSAKNLLLKAGSIAKYQVGNNYSNSFYGSPAWLGEDGFPLPEHMYKEDAIKVKSKITI